MTDSSRPPKLLISTEQLAELSEVPPPETELEAKERARADRKAALKEQRDKQRLADLIAIDDIEIALGDSNVAVIDVPYVPGLPTCVAARTPSDVELKRFRHRVAAGAVKTDDGDPKDPQAQIKAYDELADLVLVYPSADVYKEIRKARPGIHTQLGMHAAALSVGRKEKEGKA